MGWEGNTRPNQPNPTDSEPIAAKATATSAAELPDETSTRRENQSSNLEPVPPIIVLDGDGQHQQQLQQQPERIKSTESTANHDHRHRLSTSLIDSPTLPVSTYSPYSPRSLHSSPSPSLISPFTPTYSLNFDATVDGDHERGGHGGVDHTGNRQGGDNQDDRNH